MNIQSVDIKKVLPNESNPRTITEDKFQALVRSIKEFPKMLNMRPIVVGDDMVILGGNMRYRACVEAGLKKVPIIVADDLTDEQKKEFIIKDNVGFGQWDWDILNNEWDIQQLEEWGLENFMFDSMDDLDEQDLTDEKEQDSKSITLNYSIEDYNKIIAKFNDIGGSKENIVYNLLIR